MKRVVAQEAPAVKQRASACFLCQAGHLMPGRGIAQQHLCKEMDSDDPHRSRLPPREGTASLPLFAMDMPMRGVSISEERVPTLLAPFVRQGQAQAAADADGDAMNAETLKQTMRICIVSEPDILRKTLQSFLTDLGHEVVSSTVPELWQSLRRRAQPIHLAIIPQNAGKTLLRDFHHEHPETMIVLWNENRNILSAEEALAYGVYAFLHSPIHFNELEVLLVRLLQYRAAIHT